MLAFYFFTSYYPFRKLSNSAAGVGAGHSLRRNTLMNARMMPIAYGLFAGFFLVGLAVLSAALH